MSHLKLWTSVRQRDVETRTGFRWRELQRATMGFGDFTRNGEA